MIFMILIRIYRMGEVYALRDQRAGASPVAKEKPGFRLFCSIGCPVILDHFALFEKICVIFVIFARIYRRGVMCPLIPFGFIPFPFKLFLLFLKSFLLCLG